MSFPKGDRPRVSSRMKNALRTTGCRCFYCGNSFARQPRDWLLLTGGHQAVIDHKMPLRRGGPNTDDNTIVACWNCNNAKATFTVDEYRFVVGLRRGNLNHTFPFEPAPTLQRDWLAVHSAAFEKLLVLINRPSARARYKTDWRHPA